VHQEPYRPVACSWATSSETRVLLRLLGRCPLLKRQEHGLHRRVKREADNDAGGQPRRWRRESPDAATWEPRQRQAHRSRQAKGCRACARWSDAALPLLAGAGKPLFTRGWVSASTRRSIGRAEVLALGGRWSTPRAGTTAAHRIVSTGTGGRRAEQSRQVEANEGSVDEPTPGFRMSSPQICFSRGPVAGRPVSAGRLVALVDVVGAVQIHGVRGCAGGPVRSARMTVPVPLAKPPEPLRTSWIETPIGPSPAISTPKGTEVPNGT
jgi:hypothetical protein